MACQYFESTENGAKNFSIALPKLTFGRGCLEEAGKRAKARKMTKVAVFTDRILSQLPYLQTLQNSLNEAGIDSAVFSEIQIEPSDRDVLSGANFLKEGKFNGVISLGGGSVMDTAKAAMVYALYPTEFTDYFAPPIGAGRPVPGPVLPHLACPTTSGTGSECTSLSVIRINDLNTKFVMASPFILPDEVLIDPVCCESLPGNVVASSGFDLLCHAIECYTSRAYTTWPHQEDPIKRPLIQGANPWSDLAAAEALKRVGKHLERGVSDPKDQEARDSLCWAASLAGMAFGNSGTHLPHALSYGVTHLMQDITTEGYEVAPPFVPHGISVVVNAPSVFQYTSEVFPERHLEAAQFLGVETEKFTPAEAGEAVSGRIIDLMRKTGMPNGLSGVGFSPEDLPDLTKSAIRQKRAIANAPRESNETDIFNIYQNAVSYW